MEPSFLMSSFTKWIVGTATVKNYVNNLFNNQVETEGAELNEPSKQYLFRNAKIGFDLIIKGINEQNGESLMNIEKGVNLLKNKYLSTEELLRDLFSYAIDLGLNKSDRIIFRRKLYRNVRPYIKFIIENSQNESLAEFFEKRNRSLATIEEDIKNIYSVLLNDKNNMKRDKEVKETKEINCYLDLLDKAGDIYNALVDYYLELSLIPDNTYNHELVYDMAGFILHETDFYFCWDLRQKQLAEDITNHIFKYIQGESQVDKLIKQKGEKIQINVEDIYKHYLGFDIKTYPYYLNICSVIYRELVKYYNIDERDEKNIENEFFSSMITKLYKEKYDFMQGLSEEQFKSDVKQTYFANKKREKISEILS